MMRASFTRLSRLAAPLALGATLLAQTGCEDSGKKSAEASKAHVEHIVELANKDVEQVRVGLPKGAATLSELFREAAPEAPDPQSARKALEATRDAEQNLRVAKSTFFLVATADGRILRNDQEEDNMVEKKLFASYPLLQEALKKDYVESRGSMKEAAAVRGRDDAQWVAASPIKVDGQAVGVYATGWSWSAYAYRLENQLRSDVLGEIKEGEKVPLLYVYLLVGDEVFWAPVAPEINAKAIAKLKPLEKAKGEQVWTTPLEIDGRSFGVGVKRLVTLGDDVAVVVLRSET